jgi:TPR repeat protein
MFTLATWYCQGREVDENWENGFRWHLQAARAGELGTGS